MVANDQLVNSLLVKKRELMEELEVIDAALEKFQGMARHETQLHVGARRKVTKGFLSEETRQRISEKAKLNWARRKAEKEEKAKKVG